MRASPQLADGYTPIANEILEHLMKAHLSANQWQVLLCIIRKTYGFHKKVDYIANKQICDATNLCKAVVSRCLAWLDEVKLIIRKGKYIGFQKDWTQWQLAGESILPIINNKKAYKLRIVRADGYIGIWRGSVEPEFQSMATKQGYILEHRLIIARSLGRCLESWEVVHHKDGVPSNNSENNLQLLPSQIEHLPSMLAQERIKQLEAELAILQTKVDDKLAVSSSRLAKPSPTVAKQVTKVSSPAVAQKKDTITKETIQKKPYGQFKNVKLTDKEYEALVERFGETDAKNRIEKLSLYTASRGDKYKSHYATILSWEKRDKESGRGTDKQRPKQLTPRHQYHKPDEY